MVLLEYLFIVFGSYLTSYQMVNSLDLFAAESWRGQTHSLNIVFKKSLYRKSGCGECEIKLTALIDFI